VLKGNLFGSLDAIIAFKFDKYWAADYLPPYSDQGIIPEVVDN